MSRPADDDLLGIVGVTAAPPPPRSWCGAGFATPVDRSALGGAHRSFASVPPAGGRRSSFVIEAPGPGPVHTDGEQVMPLRRDVVPVRLAGQLAHHSDATAAVRCRSQV